MPRQAKPPRLVQFKHTPAWYIRDGSRTFSTGCKRREEAQIRLAEYLATNGREGVARDPETVTCAEVLAIYAEEHAPTTADPERIGYAITALLPFWGSLKVSTVKSATCRRYLKWRGKADGTMRRELNALQSAINYCHREGFITAAPAVALPPKPEPRSKWITRDEAAILLRVAYRRSPHIAHFILVGLYTGTRRDAILKMSFEPNTVGGWFDLERGVMYRIGKAERATKKRRTPAPIPRQLLGHLKRWKANGDRWPVQYRGARVDSIKTAWRKTVAEAGMPEVTPHTLKHTAITWALQNGAPVWDAAGFFSTSVETIQRVYGHHAPDYMSGAKRAIERKRWDEKN